MTQLRPGTRGRPVAASAGSGSSLVPSVQSLPSGLPSGTDPPASGSHFSFSANPSVNPSVAGDDPQTMGSGLTEGQLLWGKQDCDACVKAGIKCVWQDANKACGLCARQKSSCQINGLPVRTRGGGGRKPKAAPKQSTTKESRGPSVPSSVTGPASGLRPRVKPPLPDYGGKRDFKDIGAAREAGEEVLHYDEEGDPRDLLWGRWLQSNADAIRGLRHAVSESVAAQKMVLDSVLRGESLFTRQVVASEALAASVQFLVEFVTRRVAEEDRKTAEEEVRQAAEEFRRVQEKMRQSKDKPAGDDTEMKGPEGGAST